MKKLKLFGKIHILSIITLCTLCLFLVACISSDVTYEKDVIAAKSGNVDDAPTPLVTTYLINEVPVIYFSIPELSSRSSIIIIGKVIAAGDVINTARDVDDPTKPDPNYFSVGQIYEVEVERYLKGDGEKIIDIGQHQGFLVAGSSTPTTPEIEEAKMEADYVHLGFDQKLLMFLHKSRHDYGEYAKRTLFVPVGHPWLFDITDPECVQPIDTFDEIYVYFPPQSLTAIIKQINEPFDQSRQQETFPYPPPETLSTCPNKFSEPYP